MDKATAINLCDEEDGCHKDNCLIQMQWTHQQDGPEEELRGAKKSTSMLLHMLLEEDSWQEEEEGEDVCEGTSVKLSVIPVTKRDI